MDGEMSGGSPVVQRERDAWVGAWVDALSEERSGFRSAELFYTAKLFELEKQSDAGRLERPSLLQTILAGDALCYLSSAAPEQSLLRYIRNCLLESVYANFDGVECDTSVSTMEYLASRKPFFQATQRLTKECERMDEVVFSSHQGCENRSRDVHDLQQQLRMAKIEQMEKEAEFLRLRNEATGYTAQIRDLQLQVAQGEDLRREMTQLILELQATNDKHKEKEAEHAAVVAQLNEQLQSAVGAIKTEKALP